MARVLNRLGNVRLVWAAGGASFLPKLVATTEDLATKRDCGVSLDCITIFIDDDDAGRGNSQVLSAELIELSAKLARPPRTAHFEVLLREAT